MTRGSSKDLVSPSSNPERLLHKLSKNHKSVSSDTESSSSSFLLSTSIQGPECLISSSDPMAGRQTMADITRPSLEGRGGLICFPVTEGHTLELKHHIIQLIQNNCQFHGLAKEDANTHMRNFLKLADTFTQRGIPQTTIYLHLFPFSLTYHAQTWFDSLKPQSITSWDELDTKFLQKYFPTSILCLKKEIKREML